MLQRRLLVRTLLLGSNNSITYPWFSCLNDRGSICNRGGCQRDPKKGAPPLCWGTRTFAPQPLAGCVLGHPGLCAHMQMLEGWEQWSCPTLPEQCFSVQGLASAFMSYLKFKSMPGPSGQGEAAGGRRREGKLPLCQPGPGP